MQTLRLWYNAHVQVCVYTSPQVQGLVQSRLRANNLKPRKVRSIFPTFNPLFELCYQPELGLQKPIKFGYGMCWPFSGNACSFAIFTKDMRWYITTAAFTWIQTSWPLTWHLSLSLGHEFSLLDDCWWPLANGHSAVMLVPVFFVFCSGSYPWSWHHWIHCRISKLSQRTVTWQQRDFLPSNGHRFAGVFWNGLFSLDSLDSTYCRCYIVVALPLLEDSYMQNMGPMC